VSPDIVKLGGSLAAAGTLGVWLDAVIAQGAGRFVVVPGGGAFADAVRAAQQRHGFSDRAAHRMALLAMEQYALQLLDMAPSLRPAESEAEIAASLAGGRVALWLPHRMVAADPAIAESWDVASDSLAAWLARRLGARRLVLVKSAPAPAPPLSLKRLVALGLVDATFADYAEKAPFRLDYCGPGDQDRLAAGGEVR
jgi:5-(aminomethyl)-3-furanmethanol phosphate kinase